jgi:DNA-binding NarL/FixJ family response regulator
MSTPSSVPDHVHIRRHEVAEPRDVQRDGMAAFADRAARELQAAGETARKRTAELSTELTAQQAQIARLVREGLSNPEIGARRFISPRTVEWHLSKIFGKLGISSRRQLRSSAQLA